MRVTLITEGGYPYHRTSMSSWCHRLLHGLPEHHFEVTALTPTGHGLAPAYPALPNLAALTPVPIWDRPASLPGPLTGRRIRRAATSAAVLMCRGLVGDDPPGATRFREALVRLAEIAAGGIPPLTGTPLADVLADAWRAAAATPRLSLGDAAAAAVLLEHAVRPLATPTPRADLCHPTCGGLPLLVALAAKWRTGTPYLLTEQGIYLRERYLDYGESLPEPVRAVMLRFFRALSRLGYSEAAAVVAGSRFNQRWQLQHGAHPAKVVVVPGGVDPAEFPAEYPATGPAAPHLPAAGPGSGNLHPTVVWVGRIEPLKDLHTLIHGFWRIRNQLPAARLRLVGPTADPAYLASCQTLLHRLGLPDAVEFTGPVAHPAAAYTSGQVVVRSSICEGLPYAVIEAMMCGRATVSTDVGGVAELVEDTGVVVPPGDPAALAEAVVQLLRDPARRRLLGEAAARRARSWFTLDRLLRAYQQIYTDVATPLPAARPGSRQLQPAPGDPR